MPPSDSVTPVPGTEAATVVPWQEVVRSHVVRGAPTRLAAAGYPERSAKTRPMPRQSRGRRPHPRPTGGRSVRPAGHASARRRSRRRPARPRRPAGRCRGQSAAATDRRRPRRATTTSTASGLASACRQGRGSTPGAVRPRVRSVAGRRWGRAAGRPRTGGAPVADDGVAGPVRSRTCASPWASSTAAPPAG